MEENKEGLKRVLKERHIQMIALGCAIGTGLFYGSASAIQLAGPAIMVSYLIGGLFIYLVVRALSEMSVFNPVSGSFSTYAYEYWGDFPGFLSGWNYWFNYVAISMVEVSVVGIYMNFWFPDLPVWVSGFILFLLVNAINLINVRAFGEVEFWGALVKVMAVIFMILFGLLIILFGTGVGEPVGFGNLVNYGGFMPNGIYGVLLSFVVVTFAFGGTELIGIAAGEAEHPATTIPKAVNLIIGRIVIFYVGSMFVLVTLYPWNKVGLEGSPFVEIFMKLGISGAATLLNIIVLTAVFSAYNSCLYSNARMLHGLALQENAPAFLRKLSSNGVPYAAVLTSSVFVAVVVVLNMLMPGRIFGYVMSIATVAALINWILILITQMKFRRHIGPEQVAKLTYKMPFFPYTNYIGIAYFVMIALVMMTMDDFRIAIYLAPVWLLFIYVGYKCKRKTVPGK
jgi:amino acid transporter, AAT family